MTYDEFYAETNDNPELFYDDFRFNSPGTLVPDGWTKIGSSATPEIVGDPVGINPRGISYGGQFLRLDNSQTYALTVDKFTDPNYVDILVRLRVDLEISPLYKWEESPDFVYLSDEIVRCSKGLSEHFGDPWHLSDTFNANLTYGKTLWSPSRSFGGPGVMIHAEAGVPFAWGMEGSCYSGWSEGGNSRQIMRGGKLCIDSRSIPFYLGTCPVDEAHLCNPLNKFFHNVGFSYGGGLPVRKGRRPQVLGFILKGVFGAMSRWASKESSTILTAAGGTDSFYRPTTTQGNVDNANATVCGYHYMRMIHFKETVLVYCGWDTKFPTEFLFHSLGISSAVGDPGIFRSGNAEQIDETQSYTHIDFVSISTNPAFSAPMPPEPELECILPNTFIDEVEYEERLVDEDAFDADAEWEIIE